jgi:succinate dehydrogenase / fumarate reductase membrane anchor subunit
MSHRSPLGRARGLGSAKEGAAHWWAQRVTAIALVPLSLWFVAGVLGLIGADHQQALAWIGYPLNAVLLVILIAVTFHHAQLGLQVVIEDYVHTEWLKIAMILAVKFAAVVLALFGIIAVLAITFGG